MKNYLLLIASIAVVITTAAQKVGIGTATPHASAIFEIKSNNKGILIPRTSTSSRTGIASPAKGLMVYDTLTSSFWYHNGSIWKEFAVGSNGWNLTGNAGTDSSVNFVGTTDAHPLVFRVNNKKAGYIDHNVAKANTSLGYQALLSNTTGFYNTSLGYSALYSNINGNYNTAVGALALHNNGIGANINADEGTRNTAVGSGSMQSNTTGLYNTALGVSSLYANTSGVFNTAIGLDALQSNIDGRDNTALGLAALNDNLNGNYNTASGSRALTSNKTGYSNVAIGASALYYSTNQSNLVAIGDSALFNQGPYVGGEFPILGLNTATGSKSLFTNTYGQANTANGYRSLYHNSNGTHNTAMGISALNNNSSGSYNTSVGAYADVSSGSLSNATSIGYGAVAMASNQVMLGNTFITSVRAAGSFVIYSDGRFKENIKDNVPGLEFIKILKPVTYNYNIHGLQAHLTGNDLTKRKPISLKKDEDAMTAKEKMVYTGFVAQDVAAAANKLHYNFSGVYKPQNETDAFGLSYADFVVPLVKAVQEQQVMIEALQKQNEQLLKEMQWMKEKLK